MNNNVASSSGQQARNLDNQRDLVQQPENLPGPSRGQRRPAPANPADEPPAQRPRFSNVKQELLDLVPLTEEELAGDKKREYCWWIFRFVVSRSPQLRLGLREVVSIMTEFIDVLVEQVKIEELPTASLNALDFLLRVIFALKSNPLHRHQERLAYCWMKYQELLEVSTYSRSQIGTHAVFSGLLDVVLYYWSFGHKIQDTLRLAICSLWSMILIINKDFPDRYSRLPAPAA